MKINDVVFVRLTGEPVYVLGLHPDGVTEVENATTVRLRRGISTPNGIEYIVTEGITPRELASPTDWFSEDLNHKLEFYNIQKAFEAANQPSDEARTNIPAKPKTQLSLLN